MDIRLIAEKGSSPVLTTINTRLSISWNMKQSGIYALWYEEQDLIYIGQSVELSKREKTHKNNLKLNKHSNYKLQEAYYKYGLPEFVVLEYCSSLELDKLEISWQKEFDSLSSLDIVEAGSSRRGAYNGRSKYSKVQILKTLKLAIRPELTSQDISDITLVSLSMVDDIRAKRAHLWMRDIYPWHYKMLDSTRDQRKKYGYLRSKSKTLAELKEIVFISPDNVEVKLDCSLNDFAKRYGLDDTDLSRVISGKYKHTKCWKLRGIRMGRTCDLQSR